MSLEGRVLVLAPDRATAQLAMDEAGYRRGSWQYMSGVHSTFGWPAGTRYVVIGAVTAEWQLDVLDALRSRYEMADL